MEKGTAYASLLRRLVARGLKGGKMVVSDDPEGIKSTLAGELPGVGWQRCVVHFERSMLSHVPTSSTVEVAQDLKAIFKVGRQKTARALAEESGLPTETLDVRVRCCSHHLYQGVSVTIPYAA
jgi:putative transposase